MLHKPTLPKRPFGSPGPGPWRKADHGLLVVSAYYAEFVYRVATLREPTSLADRAARHFAIASMDRDALRRNLDRDVGGLLRGELDWTLDVLDRVVGPLAPGRRVEAERFPTGNLGDFWSRHREAAGDPSVFLPRTVRLWIARRDDGAYGFPLVATAAGRLTHSLVPSIPWRWRDLRRIAEELILDVTGLKGADRARHALYRAAPLLSFPVDRTRVQHVLRIPVDDGINRAAADRRLRAS